VLNNLIERLLIKIINLLARKVVLLITSALLFIVFFASVLDSIHGGVQHPYASTMSLLLAVNLLLLYTSGSLNTKEITKKKDFTKILMILATFYIMFMFVEILVIGHTLYSQILLATCLTVFLLGTVKFNVSESLVLVYIPSLLSLLITTHFTIVSPYIGFDTLRDVMWSEETLRSGFYTLSRISHTAYQIPSNVLIYSIMSLVGGFQPVVSSILVGLIYLYSIAILITVIVRRIYSTINADKNIFLLIMAYSIPLITLWSAWFIPQALALIFMMLLIWSSFYYNQQSNKVLQLILSTLLVFTHPGLALFTLTYFTFLFVASPSFRKLSNLLIYIAIPYVIYILFTTVQYILVPGVKSYLEYLLLAIFGEEKVSSSQIVTFRPLNATAFYVSIAIITVIGMNAIFINALKHSYCKHSKWETLTAIFAIVALIASFLIGSVGFFSTADRYIGLPAAVLLILVSYRGLDIASAKSKALKAFSYVLIFILVLAIAFNGAFTPSNPLTLNPSPYSIYGLISYDDLINLRSLAKLIDLYAPYNVYTDWRSGLFLIHEFLTDQNVFLGGGSNRLIVDNTKIWLFTAGYQYNGVSSCGNSMFILRESSFTMVESWGNIKPYISHCFSAIFNGDGVLLYIS